MKTKNFKLGKNWVYETGCHDNEYIVNLKNENELIDFYNYIRSISHKKNFGGDPYNNNMFMNFKIENDYYTIGCPRHNNGDNNWYSYSKDSKKYCTINLIE